jgi:integrase
METSELESFAHWLRNEGKAESTIYEYCNAIKDVPLSNPHSYLKENQHRHMVIQGYRLFLNYRYDMKKITLLQKQQGLESYKWKKPRRGRKYQGKAYPKIQWKNFIKRATHRVAKMGIWLGFNFGLRVGEIVHLRIQDIDLDKNTLTITGYNRMDQWQPKTSYSERTIEFNGQQKSILAKWIRKRPTLTHAYLLWNRNLDPVSERQFQRWCKQISLKTHDLRRSFATNLYYASGKDLALVKIALGHSNVAITSQYLCLDDQEAKKRIAKAMAL